MLGINITDVRVHPGDSGFLIDNGETAILYDSGFAFTGKGLVNKIKKQIGDRKLDFIFLTHSHYDHVLGSLNAMSEWPGVKVVAGEYAAKIFSKASAKAVMRKLDTTFAKTCNAEPYENLIDDLRVDIPVKNGDIINTGNMSFRVVDLPGHTKCSVGFYLEESKLLLGTETLGVYSDNGLIVPSFLVGYDMAIKSIETVEKMDIDYILAPHYGLLNKGQTKSFLKNAKKVAKNVAVDFSERIKNGASDEELLEYFKSMYYHGDICDVYPVDAMELNTGYMIKLIRHECVKEKSG